MTVFLRDVWYMAAWSEEVGKALLARRVVNVPVVLFRTRDGSPAALRATRARRLLQTLLRREAKAAGESGQ